MVDALSPDVVQQSPAPPADNAEPAVEREVVDSSNGIRCVTYDATLHIPPTSALGSKYSRETAEYAVQASIELSATYPLTQPRVRLSLPPSCVGDNVAEQYLREIEATVERMTVHILLAGTADKDVESSLDGSLSIQWLLLQHLLSSPASLESKVEPGAEESKGARQRFVSLRGLYGRSPAFQN